MSLVGTKNLSLDIINAALKDFSQFVYDLQVEDHANLESCDKKIDESYKTDIINITDEEISKRVPLSYLEIAKKAYDQTRSEYIDEFFKHAYANSTPKLREQISQKLNEFPPLEEILFDLDEDIKLSSKESISCLFSLLPPSIKHLSLSEFYISKGCFEEFTFNIARLINLRELSVTWHSLINSNQLLLLFKSIPYKIQKLKLDKRTLDDDCLIGLGNLLTSEKHEISYLKLSNCHISHMDLLVPFIRTSKLKTLILTTDLMSFNFKSVFAILPYSTITTLKFSLRDLSENALASFFRLLPKCNALRDLTLTGALHKLSEKNINLLIEALINGCALTHLQVDCGIDFDVNKLSTFFNKLKNNQSLLTWLKCPLSSIKDAKSAALIAAEIKGTTLDYIHIGFDHEDISSAVKVQNPVHHFELGKAIGDALCCSKIDVLDVGKLISQYLIPSNTLLKHVNAGIQKEMSLPNIDITPSKINILNGFEHSIARRTRSSHDNQKLGLLEKDPNSSRIKRRKL